MVFFSFYNFSAWLQNNVSTSFFLFFYSILGLWRAINYINKAILIQNKLDQQYHFSTYTHRLQNWSTTGKKLQYFSEVLLIPPSPPQKKHNYLLILLFKSLRLTRSFFWFDFLSYHLFIHFLIKLKFYFHFPKYVVLLV